VATTEETGKMGSSYRQPTGRIGRDLLQERGRNLLQQTCTAGS